MVDISIFDKVKLLFNFLKKNSLIVLVILLIGFVIMDLIYGNNKKGTKQLYIVVIVLTLIYVLFSYYKPFLNILDVYVANIFRLSYFPSIIEYTTFILITILIQFVSIKKGNKLIKNINIWVGFIIEALFIFNLVALNDIDINLNNLTSIYENNLLLSIFQLTGITFMIWIIINLMILIVNMFLSQSHIYQALMATL